MSTPQKTSMDYKNFTPTYSHRFIPTDAMTLDADEYWTPKVLRTHLKIKKLYGAIDDDMERRLGLLNKLIMLDKIRRIKSKVGIWVAELTGNPLTGNRRRNTITNSDWEQIYAFEGIPYNICLQEGIMIVLPSTETIEWLNELARLYGVSNKETV